MNSRKLLKASILIWTIAALLAVVVLLATRDTKADELGDYFDYCGQSSNIYRKVFIHGGGSEVLGFYAEDHEHDPLLCIGIGMTPGFGIEAVQVAGGGEKVWPNAILDLFLWDGIGSTVGVLVDDIFWPKKRRNK